jgi:hypothetical protein
VHHCVAGKVVLFLYVCCEEHFKEYTFTSLPVPELQFIISATRQQIYRNKSGHPKKMLMSLVHTGSHEKKAYCHTCHKFATKHQNINMYI